MEIGLLSGIEFWNWGFLFAVLVTFSVIVFSLYSKDDLEETKYWLDDELIYRLQNLPPPCETVHLIILVPGLMSPPQGLKNARLAIEKQVQARRETMDPKEMLIVHRANSNLGWKTTEGICACGRRLGNEVNTIIYHTSKNSRKNLCVKLSFVGNSLGGLISRAALSDIIWCVQRKKGSKISVQPMLFYTTNSPHIGSKDAKHVEFPDIVQYALALLLRRTGMDLFRFNDTIEKLASDNHYLDPLRRFSKRIAFSNTYRTDFQVPTASGAFLAPDSSSTHETLHSYIEKFPFAVHAVTTPSKPATFSKTSPTNIQPSDNEADCWMRDHCERLDSLGWTKVFCDLRPVLPSIGLPRFLHQTPQGPFDEINTKGKTNEWTASQLHAMYCRSTTDRFYIPLAHKVQMANVAWFGRYYSNKGLPFVEEFAYRIVDDALE